MIKPIIKIILFSSILFGCANEAETIYATINLPLISECKDHFIKTFSDDQWKHQFKWEIIEFSDPVASQQFPNLIGALVVHSLDPNQEYNEKFFPAVLNNTILDCYPTANMEIKLSEMGEKFQESLRFIDTESEKYLSLKNDKINIYFKR